MEREIKRLKRSRIPLVKVRWNSRRGPEFTWEREDSFKQKYPQLFINRASSSTTRFEGVTDRGRTKEVTKRKESKEVASIEEAYYQNKLRMYHNERSNHSTHKFGDFVLLSQNDARNPQLEQNMKCLSGKRQQELESLREQAFRETGASLTIRLQQELRDLLQTLITKEK
ncbi:hypothetical protein Tco_1538966 [Tanacetum coccineum]